MTQSTHGGRRKGAGRKPIYDKPMVPISVRIPWAHYIILKELAEVHSIPLSDVIRKAIERFI